VSGASGRRTSAGRGAGKATGYGGLPSTAGVWQKQEGEEREVSGTLARIPSRLGEPGSLFSRYKFLQLRLVVVMLLTWTRRELLKRRTIGARSTDFLDPRVTRHPLRQHRCIPRYIPSSSLSSSSSTSRASFHQLRLLTSGTRRIRRVLWSYTSLRSKG